MISFDFEYYRPDTAAEAAEIYQVLSGAGKNPLYYGGGTEIITMAQSNQLKPGAIIDIKQIPECNVFEVRNDEILIGACLNLNQAAEGNLFPLLSKTARGIADHGSRDKITIGGNICGKLIYREGVLPFLVADGEVVISGQNGAAARPLSEVFSQTMQLRPGEFITQLKVKRSYASVAFFSQKKTKQAKVDYPLLTVAALRQGDDLRVAFSGLCTFPFRSVNIEQDLNSRDLSWESRVNNALGRLPGPVLNDLRGSAAYRLFVLSGALRDMLTQLKGVGENVSNA
ncbi:nicotinate dehydrogenase FAD-subunit [Peptococcaceae bacterium CEB3]|nr:nicotinate dehydrogenase FAD-subunit [Peptococcaceae bacterium CEB3]